MYKHLLVILTIIGVTFPLSAFDFEVEREGGYSLYFNVVDDEELLVELTYPGLIPNYWSNVPMPTGMLDIPEQVQSDGLEYQVVGIGDRAFSGCSSITTLILPRTLTYIGEYAFSQCSGINGMITIPEEVQSIGRSAFYGCTSITTVKFDAIHCEQMGGARSAMIFGSCPNLTRIVFGNRVRTIPDYAFVGMDQLTITLKLPDSLQSIGRYAFAFCGGLQGNLVLPSSVEQVADYAFYQCYGLHSLALSERMRSIGIRGFGQCSGLQRIVLNSLVPPTLSDNAFAGVPRVEVEVPCVGKAAYLCDTVWKQIGPLRYSGSCTFALRTTTSNPNGGVITGGGKFAIGASTTLTVVCQAGYSFFGWTDGDKSNPRQITINDTTSYRAIVEPAKVVHEVEYVHDTTYMDGVKVVYEPYEINDRAEPIEAQQRVVYDRDHRRINVPIDKGDILNVALYNDAGVCVSTGLPRRGHINMRRMPTGYYIVRISTFDQEQVVRFFHSKKRNK